MTDSNDASNNQDGAQPSALNPTANLPALTEDDALKKLSSVAPARARQHTPGGTPVADPRRPAPTWMIYAIGVLSLALAVLILIAVTHS